jgi:CubicO group peptidase (beta-lactamase class C family)
VNTINARPLAVVFASLFFVVIIGGCSGGGSTSTASSAKAITAFSFIKAENAIPVDSQATISGTAIQAFLPPGSDLTALKAEFAASDKAVVSVGGRTQTSGVTANDFTAGATYQVMAEDGSTQNYTVSIVTEIAAFDEVVQAFMTAYAVPAVTIAATYGERLVYLKAYGLQDKEASQKATTASLFRLASVSKPITSVAIMKLVEQKKLQLSDHVFGAGALLGTTYGTQPYGAHITDITVDQLLHHTGGGWPNDGSDPMFTNPTMTADQLISWTLDNLPLTSAPGTTYAYSNFGYCILGRVIERVTGLSYEAAVKGLVLQPLGITDMTIAGNTLADRLPSEVKYYGQGGEDPYGFNIHRMDSHGGWVATARDLATILVHVDGFAAKADLLSTASIASMTTPSTVNANYACGWAVNSANNWWHLGSLPGTETEIIRGSNGWNWVMLANTRSLSANFESDMDQALWTALSHLSGVPPYDLF